MNMFFGNDDWVSPPSDPWGSLGLFDRDDWEDPPATSVRVVSAGARIEELEARVKSLEAQLAKSPLINGGNV